MKEKIKIFKERVEKMGIIKIIITLIIILAIFQAGVFVGYHKAMFYKSAGSNYFRSSHSRDFMRDPNLPVENGAVGKIVSINLPNIVVASPDNVEKTINISDDTLIRQFRDTLSAKDLKVGDYVIVLGGVSSDNGVVNAKLIRLIPPPPEGFGSIVNTTSTTSTNATTSNSSNK